MDAVLQNEVLTMIGENLAPLVRATRSLQSVALTDVICSTLFFREAEIERQRMAQQESSCFWPQLRTIALTDNSLHPINPNIPAIFTRAGLMALDMPELQTLELWNWHRACFFRYEAAGAQSIITIGATWDIRPAWTAVCLQAWDAVRAKRLHRQLRVSIALLPLEATRQPRHSSVLRHLKLRNEIIDPVSRYRMECQDLATDYFIFGHQWTHRWTL